MAAAKAFKLAGCGYQTRLSVSRELLAARQTNETSRGLSAQSFCGASRLSMMTGAGE
jgi:hypothetical protein